MPESNVVNYDNVKVKLSKDAQRRLMNETAELWDSYTQDITELIIEHEEAHELYGSSVGRPINDTLDSDLSLEDVRNFVASRRQGISLGDIPRALDTVHSLQHNITFPSDERFFKGQPLNQTSVNLVDLYEAYKVKNFAAMKVLQVFYNHRKRAMLDGTACMALPFNQKRGRKVVYEHPVFRLPNPFTGEMLIEKKMTFMPPKARVNENYVFYEGTQPQDLEFNAWRVDPYADDLDKANFMRRLYMPCHEVEEMYGIKDVKTYSDISRSQDGQEARESMGIPPRYSKALEKEEEGKTDALLVFRYDDFVIDGKVYKNHVALILNFERVVYFDFNQYNHGEKPYVITPYIPIPGSLYGKSLIKDCLKLAHTINTAATQFIDIFSWAADPPILKNIRDAAVRKHGNIVVKPGLQLPCQDINNAYAPMRVDTQNTVPLVQFIKDLQGTIQEITGASPVFAGDGMGNSTPPTAFQVGQHIQGGNSRFQALVKFFNDTSLDRFLRQSWENDKQYLSKDIALPEFEEIITPNQIKAMDLDWSVTANEATVARNQELVNLQGIMAMMPQWVQMGIAQFTDEIIIFDQGAVAKRILNRSGLGDGTDFMQIIKGQNGTFVPEPEQLGAAGQPQGQQGQQPGQVAGQSESQAIYGNAGQVM